MSLTVESNGPVAFVTLDRPQVHNAFDGQLIQALFDAFTEAGADPNIRVIVLGGAGKSFCAGGDLNWMKSMVGFDESRNREDSLKLAETFSAINSCPKPVIARVHGAAIGGGFGLVACADIAVAGPQARFGLGEVRLGLAPAVISPFVVRKIGTSKARELFLTGDRIDGTEAQKCGLVHYVTDSDLELDDRIIRLTQSLLKGGPNALTACKELATHADLWAEPAEKTAAIIASLRVSPEGQEGMRAFLDKRKPTFAGGGEK